MTTCTCQHHIMNLSDEPATMHNYDNWKLKQVRVVGKGIYSPLLDYILFLLIYILMKT